MSTILVSKRNSAATLTLNRPERMNAVSEELYQELLDALVDADADAEVRAVIITGNGRAFCAGADLKAHKSGKRTRDEQDFYLNLGQRVCKQIQTMATPVIVAVNGFALGGGAEIAFSADFLVVSQTAEIGFPEVSIGTFVGGGVTNRVPRLVGLTKATEMLMLGERFSGKQAFDWGAAYAAVPLEDLMVEAEALAAKLASKAPLSVAKMKAALYRNDHIDVVHETEPNEILDLMKTHDWAEGVAAFAERRAPVFLGK